MQRDTRLQIPEKSVIFLVGEYDFRPKNAVRTDERETGDRKERDIFTKGSL